MKSLIKYILFFAFLTSFSSCRKDLGNYDYTTIDSLFIKEIEEAYRIKTAGNPEVFPKIEFSSGKKVDLEAYDHTWLAYRFGLNVEPTLLSKQPELNENLRLDIGTYTVYYTLKEKLTNISWTKKFKIEITSGYNGGWMILSEDNGKSKIDFFEYVHATGTYPNVHRNFQEKIKDLEGKQMTLLGKPKFLTAWANQTEATGSGIKYFMYVGTDENTEKINITDGFIWKDQYAFKFETSNPALFETIDALRPIESRDGYAIKGNDVYIRLATYQWNFGTPINRFADGTYFKVSPFIAVNTGSSFATACLMYDITSKRFVRNGDFSQTAESPLSYDEGNSAFNPNNVGMDLVWMNQTAAFGGQAYAILTKDNRFYLARMTNNSVFSARYWEEITSLPDIAKASRFEVDQLYGYLQYVVGGKIYQYDPSDKTSKLMKDYGSKEVTTFKYLRSTYVSYTTVINPKYEQTYGKRFLPATTGLIVGTYDPSQPQNSGKVDIWQVPQFNGAFKEFLSFDGFGKVADVAEAEAPFGW